MSKTSKGAPVTVVDRPLMRPQSKIPREVLLALMDTAVNGKAVRLPLNGRTRSQVVSKYAALLRARGYGCHSRIDGTYVILWADDRNSAKGEGTHAR